MALGPRAAAEVSTSRQRAAFESFVELLENRFALPDGVGAAEAASAVLCTLEQRLSLGEARHILEAAPSPLPLLMRSCVMHRREALGQVFDRSEFMRRVAEHLHIPDELAEQVIRAVFAAVQQLPGELELEGHLPSDLRQLWDSAAGLSSR